MGFQGYMMRCCLATETCSEKCCIIVQTQCVLPQNNMGVMSLVDKKILQDLCFLFTLRHCSIWGAEISVFFFLAWNLLRSSCLSFAEITDVF